MKFFQRFTLLWAILTTMAIQAPNAQAGDAGLFAVLATSAAIVAANRQSHDTSDTEANVTFVPSLGLQQKHLKFDQKLRFHGGYGTDAKFETDLPTANVSLTTSYKKVFVTIKYEKSLVDGTTEAKETLQPQDHQQYFNIPGGVTEVDREDMNLTLGYNLVSSLNVFVGYMKGKTEIRPDKGCYWALTDPLQTCDNDPRNGPGFFNPNGQLNLAWTQSIFGGSRYQQNYREDGPYVGLSYAWQIADAGSLSFSAAYARMDAEYKDNYLPDFDLNFAFTGKSTGTSVGLTWTAPMGESSNYFFDIRQQKYSMDADESNGNFPGATAKTNETMQGVTAGVQVYF